MEEAYTALYQEFIHLQGLCKRQAKMLQELTEVLTRQQVPVHYRHEELRPLIYCEPPAAAAPPNPAALNLTGDAVIGGLMQLQLDSIPNDGAWGVNCPGQQRTEQNSILDELRQAERRWHNSQLEKPTRRPWSSSFLNSEMLSETGGIFMSRVTLQSRVCEFCHAVFPGHTTTRGEFLRHLTSHIS